MKHIHLFLSVSVLAMGCLTAQKVDTTEDTSTTTTETATIYDIQTGAVVEGTTVTLQNVVVTSSITADEDGFFIQDEGGGEWSGIYVFIGQAGGGIAPLVGDKLTITGSVAEYYDSTQLVISSAESMQVTGETTPVATVVSSVDDWEAYEGCLVSLADQTVVSDVNSYGEANLSMGIPMDNSFFNFDTEYGAHYDSITGVITYSFSAFKINPRDASDLEGYTAGEAASPVTVAEVQSGDFVDRMVTLENVVVTEASSDFDGNSVFWVQDEGAGDWSGLYVFLRPNTAAQVTINRGDVVNLQGMISEYYDYTELVIGDAADVEVVSNNAVPLSTVLAESPSDWEMYEGMLITLENATIGAGGQYGQYAISNFTGIKLDDELYRYTIAEGDVVAQLTGVVYYSYGEFVLLPRDSFDVGQDGTETGDEFTTVMISECRDGSVPVNSDVKIDSGVVTAVAGNKVYIQDPAGSTNAGMLVFMSNLNFSAAVGDAVSVQGQLIAYYDLLEISVRSESDFVVVGPSTPVSPTVVSNTPGDWELYESMLITLDGVEVTSGPDANGNFETNMGLLLSDYWFAGLSSSVAVGQTYSITGVINQFQGNYELLIKDASMITQ